MTWSSFRVVLLLLTALIPSACSFVETPGPAGAKTAWLVAPPRARAAALPTASTFHSTTPYCSNNNKMSDLVSSATALRGGATDLLVAVSSNLQQPGGLAISTLWGVASAIVVPLTLYRRTWSFSVGYGLSVFGMGLSLLRSHFDFNNSASLVWKEPQFVLLGAVLYYGIRLASYLFVRQQVSANIQKLMTANETKDNRLKRIPLALSVALFYTFMTTPAMYALAVVPTSVVAKRVAYGGAGLAWLGALLEAIADGHKLKNKMSSSKDDDDDNSKFVGPTGGVYQVCRHPNYLGEILFWIGVFVGGAPSFQKDIAAWGCSSLGLFGIVNLMTGAAKRLDKKQLEKYGGQKKFDDWNSSVKSSIVPFVV